MSNYYDVIIVGGGPAGISTALTINASYPEKKILLLREDKVPIVPCGMHYLIWKIKDGQEHEFLCDDTLKNVDLEIEITKVVDIDRKKKTITTADNRVFFYDRLVLATGSLPSLPDIEGKTAKGVFVVKKDFEYLLEIKRFLKNRMKIGIIGGGFVGVEMADLLSQLGKEVILIYPTSHILENSFDREFYTIAEDLLIRQNVKLYPKVHVKRIIADLQNTVKGVELDNNTIIDIDAVIFCTGMKPNIELAEKIGLEIGKQHGIVVDEYMRTSDPNIFAVGDCTEEREFFTRQVTSMMLASIATSEGRIAGSNIFNLRVIRQNKGTVGIYSTIIGNSVFGCVGMTESRAKQNGFDYIVGECKTYDKHHSAFGNSKELYVKLIFSRESDVILGGQVFGSVYVAELLNLIGLCVQKSMTISELITLQIGTHPVLTSSPASYPIILAAVDAMRNQLIQNKIIYCDFLDKESIEKLKTLNPSKRVEGSSESLNVMQAKNK
ncbi:MAG: FAD-dependent oxidoreductase [Candidatus Micrarchaeota archaeon]|nr:FAD-dependent oxidoreductase [Candidatus Micrarchaeota archaeon]